MALSQHEENATQEQAAHWDRTEVRPVVPPGSHAEDEALAAIDRAREAELVARADTNPGKRRRRHGRYWRARGLHVDV